MNEAKFVHATLKTEVTIYADQVFAIFHGPVQNATMLLGPGSVAVPVIESVDEAKKIIRAAKVAPTKE